jgi:hypothetical protein
MNSNLSETLDLESMSSLTRSISKPSTSLLQLATSLSYLLRRSTGSFDVKRTPANRPFNPPYQNACTPVKLPRRRRQSTASRESSQSLANPFSHCPVEPRITPPFCTQITLLLCTHDKLAGLLSISSPYLPFELFPAHRLGPFLHTITFILFIVLFATWTRLVFAQARFARSVCIVSYPAM